MIDFDAVHEQIRALRGFPRRHSAADIMLLRAALLDGPAAIAAYETLLKTFDLAGISHAWQRLLPQLHDNLARHRVSDHLTERFRGVRRYVWVRNLKLMTLARQVFAALHESGAPWIVLKGAAIFACYLKDRSLRPMDDIDILVPESRLGDVAAALATIGLGPRFTSARSLIGNEHLRSTLPGWPFVGGEQNIDIHWKTLHLDRGPRADERFWSDAQPATLDGVAIRVLDPADQLLHVIAHAAQSDAALPLQWVSDAALIIRGDRPVSWQRFSDEASDHRLSAVAADALAFLSAIIGLKVPPDIVARLRGESALSERIEARLFGALPRSGLNRWARSFVGFQDFRRGPAGLLGKPASAALGSFMQDRTGTASTASAALALGHAALGKPAWLRRMARSDRDLRLPDRRLLPKPEGILRLSSDGCDETPLIRGWSVAEARGRWTLGLEASIAWRSDESIAGMALVIDAEPLLAKKHRRQRVDLWLNDRRIASWRFQIGQPPEPIVIPLSADIVAGRDVLVLTLQVRRPRSPTEIGLYEDDRPLGLFVRTVGFSKIPPAQAG